MPVSKYRLFCVVYSANAKKLGLELGLVTTSNGQGARFLLWGVLSRWLTLMNRTIILERDNYIRFFQRNIEINSLFSF
jgi:xylose isomerase